MRWNVLQGSVTIPGLLEFCGGDVILRRGSGTSLCRRGEESGLWPLVKRQDGREPSRAGWLAGPMAWSWSAREGRASPTRCCSRISASRVRRNKEVVARDCRSVNIEAHGATPIAHATREITACVEEETSLHVVGWAGNTHIGNRMSHNDRCRARRLCMNRTSKYMVHVHAPPPGGRR